MRACNKCHKKEGVHRWGKWWLCDVCHIEWLKERKSKDSNFDITIPKESQSPWVGGFYSHGDGIITLCNYIEEKLMFVLHHEIIHHVLNIIIDPPTSYDYDNISLHGKIDKFAVCDERRE